MRCSHEKILIDDVMDEYLVWMKIEKVFCDYENTEFCLSFFVSMQGLSFFDMFKTLLIIQFFSDWDSIIFMTTK